MLHDAVRTLPELDDSPLFGQDPRQKLRKCKQIVRPEDQLHHRVTLPDLLYNMFFLHHAAAKAHDQFGIFLFEAGQYSEVPVDMLVCIFPDRTGIVENKIGFLFLIRVDKADRIQYAPQFLGIPGVHLAAERHDAGAKGAAFPPLKTDQRPMRLLHVLQKLLFLHFFIICCFHNQSISVYFRVSIRLSLPLLSGIAVLSVPVFRFGSDCLCLCCQVLILLSLDSLCLRKSKRLVLSD